MKEFKTFHPVVNFAYFLFTIGFAMFFMHPVCLAISFVCAFTYSVLLKGRKAVKANLVYMLPMIAAMALINPAFNHEGVTVVGYFPSGNPLTLESVYYGLAAAVMIVSVICCFSCFNEIMTSDKLIYLFGRITPSLSLILSMILRFVPKFLLQLKETADAQRLIGRDVSSGGIIKRAKNALTVLSVMTALSLENSIQTADSMKARGYDIGGRTSFSIYTFDKRDKITLLSITFLGLYTLFGNLAGGMYFRYFPSVKSAELSPFGLSVFAAYFALCICPVIIEIWEAGKWKALKSKI